MSKNIYQFLYLVGIAILAFSSCDLSFLNGNRSYQYSLVDGDEISNIPDDEFFNVNIKSAYYTGDSNTFDPLDFIGPYAMDEGPGTDCKISINEESATEDLYCMLEVAEGDLWLHEINLQYNVPPGMCPYLAFLPHWHYNHESGYGPPTVYACDRLTGTSSSGESQYEKVYSLYTPELPDEDNKRVCIGNSKKEIENLCPYNKSTKEGDGDLQNCCIGKYRVIGGDEKDSGDWGGDIKNCIGGLARTNWDTFDKDGFPAVLIVESGSKGVKEDYTLYPLYDKIDHSARFSLPIANYFKDAEDKEGGEPAYHISPISPVSGTRPLRKGEPFITWACLDQNKEVRHTIKLIIREWDTKEEFNRFKESEGSSGDPDTVGFEGADCDYYENKTLHFGECDDLWDADRFLLKFKEHNNYINCASGCLEDEKDCEDFCTTINTTCDSVCDTAETTCEADCTTAETTCGNACDASDGPCKTACTDTKTACDRVCTNTKTACDSACTDTKTACENDVCTIARNTCDTSCTYPLITYK